MNTMKTPDDVALFLSIHNISDPDPHYEWECPCCGAKNCGAYFSHETPCTECRKYSHPRLSNLKEPFDVQRERARIQEIHKLLAQYEDVEGEIEQLEEERSRLGKRLDELGY